MSGDASTQSMPDPNSNSNVADSDLRERELALKERELALKEQEAKAKIELEKRGIWFTSPLLIGLASAIFGLIGTGVGAVLQGYSNFQLERQKFEFALIQKALDIKDRNEAAKQLIFLVDSGVIQSLDGEKIRRIAEQPDRLPISLDVKVLRRDIIQGCVVKISHSLVSLVSQPDVFSQELIRIEPGEYEATEQVITSFGNLREDSWLQIEFEGRRGWIRNDTWTIDVKSRTCP
jgi:hypothetical protein